MKVSILSQALVRYPLEHVFQVASMFGYDGIEISGCRPHGWVTDMTDAYCDQILSWQEQYKLEVSMYGPRVLCPEYSLSATDPRHQAETIDWVCKAMDAAKKINTPRIQLTTEHSGYYQNRKKVMQAVDYTFCKLCEYAEKVGIDLVVEGLNHTESNVIVYLDDVVELLERIGSTRLKGMIDTVMPMTNYELYDEFFEKLGDKMAYVHYSDANGVDEYPQLIGTGVTQFEEVVTILRRNGYDGWMANELGPEVRRDPELYASMEIRKVREILERTKHIVQN